MSSSTSSESILTTVPFTRLPSSNSTIVALIASSSEPSRSSRTTTVSSDGSGCSTSSAGAAASSTTAGASTLTAGTSLARRGLGFRRRRGGGLVGCDALGDRARFLVRHSGSCFVVVLRSAPYSGRAHLAAPTEQPGAGYRYAFEPESATFERCASRRRCSHRPTMMLSVTNAWGTERSRSVSPENRNVLGPAHAANSPNVRA